MKTSSTSLSVCFGPAISVAFVCVTVIAPPARGASVEERLAALEAEVQSLRKENQQLRQDFGLARPSDSVVARPAGKESALAINGLVQVQGEFGDRGDTRGQANDRVRLRRVRLGASGKFLEDFDFKVEGEFAGSGAVLTDGYLNWNRFPQANVRVGQFKAPFGYELLAADPRLYMAERSFGTDRLTLGRQAGVQVNGDFFEKRLGYAAGAFNGNGQNLTTNDNENFNFVGRVSTIPWQGEVAGSPATWTLGADGFQSRDTSLSMPADFAFAGNSFTGKRRGIGVDAQLTVGPFNMWAEWLDVRFRPASGVPAATFDASAWYVQGTCFVVPKRVQLALRYDTFDPVDTRSGNETNTWTLGANWYLKGDDLKFQFNYGIVDVPAPLPRQEQLLVRSQLMF